VHAVASHAGRAAGVGRRRSLCLGHVVARARQLAPPCLALALCFLSSVVYGSMGRH
jgi:hypothetical protein